MLSLVDLVVAIGPHADLTLRALAGALGIEAPAAPTTTERDMGVA